MVPSPSLSNKEKASLNSAICSSLSCVAVADSVIFLCYGVNACAVKWQLWTRLVDDRQFSFGSTKNLLLLLRIKPKNNPSTTSSLVSAMNPPGLSQDKSCQDRNSTGNTNTSRAHQTRQRRRKNPTGQYEGQVGHARQRTSLKPQFYSPPRAPCIPRKKKIL